MTFKKLKDVTIVLLTLSVLQGCVINSQVNDTFASFCDIYKPIYNYSHIDDDAVATAIDRNNREYLCHCVVMSDEEHEYFCLDK